MAITFIFYSTFVSLHIRSWRKLVILTTLPLFHFFRDTRRYVHFKVCCWFVYKNPVHSNQDFMISACWL